MLPWSVIAAQRRAAVVIAVARGVARHVAIAVAVAPRVERIVMAPVIGVDPRAIDASAAIIAMVVRTTAIGVPAGHRAVLIVRIRRERARTGKGRPPVHVVILRRRFRDVVLRLRIGQPLILPTAAGVAAGVGGIGRCIRRTAAVAARHRGPGALPSRQWRLPVLKSSYA